jgi:hypothetical protein
MVEILLKWHGGLRLSGGTRGEMGERGGGRGKGRGKEGREREGRKKSERKREESEA